MRRRPNHEPDLRDECRLLQPLNVADLDLLVPEPIAGVEEHAEAEPWHDQGVEETGHQTISGRLVGRVGQGA